MFISHYFVTAATWIEQHILWPCFGNSKDVVKVRERLWFDDDTRQDVMQLVTHIKYIQVTVLVLWIKQYMATLS